MEIVKQTSTYHTTALKNRKIKYIVIHYTAGVNSKSGHAISTAKWFATTDREGSADFIVDDTTAVQYNADIENRWSWHCGGSKIKSSKGGSLNGICTNQNSIGIEVCSSTPDSKTYAANNKNWYFTDAVVDKTVELTKYLMKKYNIPASNVVRHYDVTGKFCPGIVGWNANSGSEAKWNAFKARLTDESESKKEDSSSSFTPYKVKVNISTLNIRSGPGTNYAATGKYTGKGIFTITEVKSGKGSNNGWGKLKSGVGWISLDYTTKYK